MLARLALFRDDLGAAISSPRRFGHFNFDGCITKRSNTETLVPRVVDEAVTTVPKRVSALFQAETSISHSVELASSSMSHDRHDTKRTRHLIHTLHS